MNYLLRYLQIRADLLFFEHRILLVVLLLVKINLSLQFDVIMKCTVAATIPLLEQVERFEPDRLILVTRNIDDIRWSLSTKPWRDQAGATEEKIAVYRNLLLRGMDLLSG